MVLRNDENLLPRIKNAVKNVEMENWGAWLNVKRDIKMTDAQLSKVIRIADDFTEPTGPRNTTLPVFGDNVYAQITFHETQQDDYSSVFKMQWNFFVTNNK